MATTPTITTHTMTTAAARALGREHGALVPADPASSDQAWSDCRAAAEMRGASADCRAAYAKGHMEGQRGDAAG